MPAFVQGDRGPGRRAPSSYPASASHLQCAGCQHDYPVYAIIIRVGQRGERCPLCYDCYEAQTGGIYQAQDEYWGGFGWIPLSKGE